jgi:hypothetical protein
MEIRENLQKYVRREDEIETMFTNPRYDRHQLCPSGWISERLVMAMCFDVVFESDI